ncbi:DUF5615 family PIN-like protein [Natronoarchaeum sp. GCM10025703]|uniref:DUF5615 family PIN-like protein n=1 Tax=unclassified Natronoarchaeum TaxID=2620183 RepID=UPI003616AFBF
MTVQFLLDEHVGRVFERVLRERGYAVLQAKDQFGERTTDESLVRWCENNDTILISNNAKDFEQLHRELDHAGIFLYYDQELPDTDPEGLARTIESILEQYGTTEIENQLVDLGEWYQWIH